MSDPDRFIFAVVVTAVALLVALLGSIAERQYQYEKFVTFCTEQNIPYAKCKEEWVKR